MQLTPEELKKATEAARAEINRWQSTTLSGVGLGDLMGDTVNHFVTAAFAAIEPDQVHVPEDLVERMLRAWFTEQGTVCCNSPENVRKMTAVLHVVRKDSSCQLPSSPVVLMPDGTRMSIEDPRVLGEPSESEMIQSATPTTNWSFGPDGDYARCASVFASRRARLLQPKTPEQELAESIVTQLRCVNLDDPNYAAAAKQYIAAQIAKLKADGKTV